MTVSSISVGQIATASDVLILGKSNIIVATRAPAAASGDVAYSGVGFSPRTVIAFSNHTDRSFSTGFGDINLAEQDIVLRYDSTSTNRMIPFTEAYLVSLLEVNSETAFQKATLKTLDTDGFTLNWEKGGAGISVSGDLKFLCLG